MNEEEVSTLVKAVQDNAERLGLSWSLKIATCVKTSPFKVRFDGDDPSEHTIESALETQPLTGDRVYVMTVPPSGNYAIGFVAPLLGRLVDIMYCTASGLIASSNVLGTEIAVPSASWTYEPSITFKNERSYMIMSDPSPFATGTPATFGQFVIRKGAASVTGTVLALHRCHYPANFNNTGKNEVMTGWVKNFSGADITTKLSLTVTWTVIPVGANGLSIYGGDAVAPTYVSVWELPRMSPLLRSLGMFIQI